MTFSQEIYELCAKVPKGKVTTYKELAHALGTRAYRGVGQALRSNPYAPQVPCHRVVRSDGSLGGFKGAVYGEEIEEKVALLKEEGVEVVDGYIDLEKFGFVFKE